jgi:hypothetical protein
MLSEAEKQQLNEKGYLVLANLMSLVPAVVY